MGPPPAPPPPGASAAPAGGVPFAANVKLTNELDGPLAVCDQRLTGPARRESEGGYAGWTQSHVRDPRAQVHLEPRLVSSCHLHPPTGPNFTPGLSSTDFRSKHHEAGTLTPVAACSMHRVANGSQTRQPWFALVTVVSRDAGKGGEAASGLSSRWEVEEAAVRVPPPVTHPVNPGPSMNPEPWGREHFWAEARRWSSGAGKNHEQPRRDEAGHRACVPVTASRVAGQTVEPSPGHWESGSLGATGS
ncbi:hypothetical protein CB1_000125008 [Camelus ferus]|nr:hypothetical protein CB1_000125008 [Camelus ferus]